MFGSRRMEFFTKVKIWLKLSIKMTLLCPDKKKLILYTQFARLQCKSTTNTHCDKKNNLEVRVSLAVDMKDDVYDSATFALKGVKIRKFLTRTSLWIMKSIAMMKNNITLLAN